MPVTRMRMRQWLEQMIDSSTVTGLCWLGEDRKMFSIPWKHAARHGWELDKDACLFKKWAIHTGKYIEGHTCDPKTWKANFRCAMNSLPDIEEVKNKSINKGHQAVRVFRMLPPVNKSRDKRNKAKETKRRRKSQVKQEEDSDYSETQSPASTSEMEESTQESTVDSTVHAEQTQGRYEEPDLNNFSHSVEIDTFSDNFSHRFQVSPEHCSEDDMADEITNDIVRICQQLERDSYTSSFEPMGNPSNEACPSPQSSWSDSSSDIDDLRHYTDLSSDLFREPGVWGELFATAFI